ncbi:MAG: hypothetical protein QOE70_317 [Chthoniobacter sp.]|jgi:hypothetical protein|nr:hypothetical protein [Chthoniobacter sp.]
MSFSNSAPAPRTWWNPLGRAAVFALAATSIACLLAEFYGLGSMRVWVCGLLLPACAMLALVALVDARRNDGQLARMVVLGTLAGLAAAIAYDLFRVPFVWAREWHLDPWLPAMKLFKVFPRFGAMILGQPVEQAQYSSVAQLIGWTYHFSNGATFGVMYLAMIGDAARRHWAWAVVMAVGLELGMLLTPYPQVFGIHVSATFVIVTLIAHLIFGIALGLLVKHWRDAHPERARAAI